MLPSKAVLASRIATMRAAMDQQNFAALVLFSHPSLYVGPGSQTLGNVRYLTGYSSAWHPSLLVLPCREKPVLIVPDPFELKGWALTGCRATYRLRARRTTVALHEM